jgi:hypothetical protein
VTTLAQLTDEQKEDNDTEEGGILTPQIHHPITLAM